MSHNTRKKREWGGTQNISGAGSVINKKSALSAAYAELGKELTSGKLRSIGTYTLGRPIGEGTYGKVRLGTHRLTGVRVAIKQVPKAHSSTLTREIHHHRRLHHPNIMQLYEVLASESYIWMVTELCAGGELYDYLVERGTMPEPEARRIFGQLCMAVAYIHDRGIVHRDLKLENVLLDERCNVKLGDFGFTREFEGKKLMETFCGTTGYAAPEMLAGRRYTGEEVDVWSLGIILYALVCGALPFDDDDDSVMKDKILKGDFELPDVLSEECLDLITKILQQDPTARPTINDILRHPWFTKIMAPMQMETVNEDVHDVQPLESVAESSASDSRFLTAKSGMLATSPGEIEEDKAKEAEDRMHKVSSSGLSDTSFFSAQSKSDSESSDKQSNHTQTTSPTSDGGDEEAKVAMRLAEELKPTSAPLSLKHRNESQTTIKRQASASSDASRIATGTSSKSNSAPLPTHSESSEAGGNTTEDTFTPMMAFSSPLEKRPSQSSSRGGHHRTPSRTKRRSSGGLSDHHPPSLDLKPVDYIALLELSTPAIFSTVLEQNLLHQLSGLGMDVGQIVHSVVNEACDASGAMWWILKKKAEEKLQQEHDQGLSPYMSTYTLAHAPTSAPNPAPGNEYGRQRNDSNVSDYRNTEKYTAAKTSPLVPPRDLVRPTAVKPTSGQVMPLGSSNPEADIIKIFDIPQRESSNVISEGPLSDITHGPVVSQYTNMASRQPRPSPQRNRASSFSARLTQVLAGKDKEMRNENGESSIMIGNEQISIEERSKSPVMPGFFSKKSERNSPSPASTPKGDKKKDVKSPLRPDPTASVSSHTKSENKRTESREEKRDQGSPGGSPMRKGKGKAENLTDKSDLKATKSFETFSTISSNSHTDGTNDSSTTKSKSTKSSFLHTVRNWLGTDDKSGNGSSTRVGTTKKKKKRQQQQQQQQQQLQLQTKFSASGSQRQMHSPVNVKRLSSTQGLRPASPAMVRNGSLRRQPPVAYPTTTSVARSPRLSQRGSISRRSSSGSVQYATITQRPLNPRRPSAGSITPTTVGPGVEDFLLPIRQSRPSSAQSHNRPLASLHAKSGSTGSSNSFARMQSHGSGYSGSLRGIHARRPSVDGGTTVRRHRHYPHHARSDSMSRSRPSTPNRNSIIEDVSMDTITPRRSLDFDVGRSSPLHTPRASHQSVFVAHRSRTPYKPPSANPSLHQYDDRDQGQSSHSIVQGRLFYHGFQPPTAFGTWRRSWGKPPPSWVGPVDQQSSNYEKKSDEINSVNTDENQQNGKMHSTKPALRDVFANRESDDDWEDEDDEPTYAGGLGQLASSSWVPDLSMSSISSYSQQPSTPISKRTEGMPNNLLNSGRYAGVRNIFQPPSLGRETMPRTWIMSSNEESKEIENGTSAISTPDSNAKDSISSSSPIRRPISLMSANANNTVNPSTTTNTSSVTATNEANKDNIATASLSNTASRVRSAAPTFKGPVTIEEEEEDE